MHGRKLSWLLTLLIVAGCEAKAATEAPGIAVPGADLASAFNPAQTGTICGTVFWDGAVPELLPERFFATPTLPGSIHAHPHLPCVDSASRGLREAVVYLRRVDPRRARAWPHGPVRIEHAQREMRVLQDGQSVTSGFLRRGDEIEAVSRDNEYHCLRGRGASFFALALPDRDVVSRRRLEETGIVELTSGAYFFWMNAHLFVVEHPYYTRSDAQGRFMLEQVPAGNYEIVCWLPSWIVRSRERDPESGLVCRLVLAPPCEQQRTLQVESGQTSRVLFNWSRERMRP
jgi:hypothetical protein